VRRLSPLESGPSGVAEADGGVPAPSVERGWVMR
jgi:hypothetical protein